MVRLDVGRGLAEHRTGPARVSVDKAPEACARVGSVLAVDAGAASTAGHAHSDHIDPRLAA